MDINEARAADDVTAAVMKYAETTAAEDELATGMLQAAQGEGITKENVSRMLQDAQDMFTRGILDRVTKTADMLKIVQNNLRMDPGAAETLYKAGSKAAQTWEENRVKQAAERGSTLNPGNGKVTYGKGVNLDELSETQKTRVEALSAIAQKVGFNVEFINDTENKARYGEYNPATGSVTINLAGESGTGIAHHLMVTAGHEHSPAGEPERERIRGTAELHLRGDAEKRAGHRGQSPGEDGQL